MRGNPIRGLTQPGQALVFMTLLLATTGPARGGADDEAARSIPIADLEPAARVTFSRNVLPILRKSCLACHNRTRARGGLILETPAAILEGGDTGPAVATDDVENSLLLIAASHRGDPVMPPARNNVGAEPLTPDELGILKRWIELGATDAADETTAEAINWQPLPPGVNPIYAVAVTADGRFAACSRANQVFVYHLPSGRLVDRLTDDSLLAEGLYHQRGVAHHDLVQSLAFSPDGERLASGGFRTVKIWRRPRHTTRLRLGDVDEAVHRITVSPDGTWAAGGEAKGAITLWSLPSGRVAQRLEGHGDAVTGLEFASDSKSLVSASRDKTIRGWNITEGKESSRMDTPAPVEALVTVLDGSHLAAAGEDGVIRIFTFPVGEPSQTAPAAELKGHEGAASTLATFSPGGRQLVSGGADGTIRLWHVEEGSEIRQWQHGQPVVSVAASPDGSRIASTGDDHQVRLWTAEGESIADDMRGDMRLALRVDRLKHSVAALEKRIETRRTIAAEAEKRWKGESESVAITTTELAGAQQNLAARLAENDAAALARSAAEQDVAAAKALVEQADSDEAKAAAEQAVTHAEASLKALVEAADKAAKQVEEASRTQRLAEQNAELAARSANRAGEELLYAQARVIESQTVLKQQKAALESASNDLSESRPAVRALAFTFDSHWLVTAGDDGRIHIWDAASGTGFDHFAAHDEAVTALAFGPDGWLLSAASNKIAIRQRGLIPAWNLDRTIGRADDPSVLVDRVTALAFSPDGRSLATGGGEPSRSGQLTIWNAVDGTPIRDFADAHSDTILGLGFSPDGKHLATAATDRFVKVFRVDDGSLMHALEGHTGHVLDVAWRADGEQLASCGADNVIKLWNAETGESQKTVRGYDKEVTSISFVGLGDGLLTTSGDPVVQIRDRKLDGVDDFMYRAAVTADGATIVAGGQDSVLRVWIAEDGKLVHHFAPPEPFATSQGSD